MHTKTYVYLKDCSSFEAVIVIHQVNSTCFLNAAKMYVIMQYVCHYIIDCSGFGKKPYSVVLILLKNHDIIILLAYVRNKIIKSKTKQFTKGTLNK